MSALLFARVWGFLKSVPWFVWIGLAVVALWLVDRNAQYREGRADERVEWEVEVERIRDERDALARVLASKDEAIAQGGETAIETRRQELDNATANIPDQSLTPRQRARVCSELRRQGRGCEFLAPATSEY